MPLFLFWGPERLEAECYHVCDEINISLPREKTPDAQEDGLASTPLQAMRSGLTAGEKQEDADNLKNSTRASQAGLNSNAIHIPVTITAPPGETTLIPSECHRSAQKNTVVCVFFYAPVSSNPVNNIDCENFQIREEKKNLEEDEEANGPRQMLPYSSMFIFGQANP